MMMLSFLQCIRLSPQFDVICKPDEGLFSPIIQVQLWRY